MADVDDIEKIIAEVSPYYRTRAEKIEKKIKVDLFKDGTISSQQYDLQYDSSSESLEPVLHFGEEKSVHCKYICALRWG